MLYSVAGTALLGHISADALLVFLLTVGGGAGVCALHCMPSQELAGNSSCCWVMMMALGSAPCTAVHCLPSSV
jgi:hypothetical protein